MGLPKEFALGQNYPNPFNPTTVVRYDLAVAGRVRVHIYDVRGSLLTVLQDTDQAPGRYEVAWNGTDTRGHRVASGVYFCRLNADGLSLTRKMVLLE